MADLTFCLGFRAWYPDHLRRCLQSLLPFGCPVVVTIGDETRPDWCASNGTVMDTAATWIHRPMTIWSRSVALNHAIRTAETPYVCCTDADMIFPSHWWPAACRMIRPSRMLLTDSRDLDPDVTDRWDGRKRSAFVSADSRLQILSTPHSRVGQGGAMVMARDWVLGIGGFDEAYTGWGSEDNDLVARARWDGLIVAWILDTFVAHQWHSREATPNLWAHVLKNRAYLAKRLAAGGPVRRNGVAT